MKVFLDTNVLISNFMWGGVCAKVVERVLTGHRVMTGELVLEEIERVLSDKFDVPSSTVREYTAIFRHYHVEPRADHPYDLPIDDPSDPWILAEAVNAGADVLVTGDKSFRSADTHVDELLLCTPREFLEFVADEDS